MQLTIKSSQMYTKDIFKKACLNTESCISDAFQMLITCVLVYWQLTKGRICVKYSYEIK